MNLNQNNLSVWMNGCMDECPSPSPLPLPIVINLSKTEDNE